MKISIILATAILTGCTTFQDKATNYRNAASMAANPEKIRIVYEREGGTASFMETRCSGSLCEED